MNSQPFKSQCQQAYSRCFLCISYSTSQGNLLVIFSFVIILVILMTCLFGEVVVCEEKLDAVYVRL